MSDDVRRRAWALKDACYAAWTREPAAAGERARELRQLADAHPTDPELQALAHWTAGIAALATGQPADALGHLHGARRLFAAAGRVQHVAEATVPAMVALGMLGCDDEAIAMAEEARTLFAQAGDELGQGKIEHNLATLLTRRDRHAEAAAMYRRAAVRFAHVQADQASIQADIGLGQALTWLADFDEADAVNRRARMRAQARALTVLEAQAGLAIGRLELLRGRWHEALRELSQASRQLDASGAAPQLRLEANAALAEAYAAVRLWPEAAALHDRVVVGALGVGAPLEQARSLLERARAQGRCGLHGQAHADLQAARVLFARLDNAAALAGTDLALAALHLQRGEREAALTALRAALPGLRASGMRPWRLEAQVLEAAALAQGGDADAAAARWRETLAEAEELLPVALPCRIGLATVAAERGDDEAATAALAAALDLFEAARAALPGDELRAAAAADVEQAYDLWVQLALRSGDAGRVCAAIERGRARALELALAERGSAPAVPAGAALRWHRRRWREACLAGPQAQPPDALDRIEQELLEAQRRWVIETRSTASPPTPFALPRLQQALAPDQAFVGYHVAGDRVCACVVRADDVSHHSWVVERLDQRVRGLAFQMEALRFGAPALQGHADRLRQRVQAHLQGLHAAVWAPLAAALADVPRLVVAPHGWLHYLPFPALYDGRRWLVERHEIVLTASAAVWLSSPEGRIPASPSVLALGVGEQLPQVEAEIAELAAVHGGRLVACAGADATAAALRDKGAGADIVHIACHGEFRADNPAFSSLQLADGPLPLHEAAELDLRAGLVLLSACETGMSRQFPGDDRIGLVRSLARAGAAQALATLWAVDDASTARFMGRLHRRLRDGERCAAALRAEQMVLAREGVHPFHWSGFVLHGRG